MSDTALGLVLYLLTLLNIGAIYAVLCLGLNVQWGVTGLFNVGIAGFFAVGAYTSAILTAPESPNFLGGFALPVPVGWVGAMLLSGICALLIGAATIRLRADYLAIGTIGIAEIIRLVLKNEEWMTNGVRGITTVPRPLVFDSPLLSEAAFLAMLLAIIAVIYWALERAVESPWGRMMRAIRDNHVAAASMGKNVTARQLEIFVFGSVLMGIGGAILVTFVQIFDPSSYQPINHTFIIWVMIIVGGAGNNWGAIFGAVLIWLVWVISEPLARFVFDWVSLWSTSLGWGAIPEIDSRAAQMRVFVLGLVITIALRFAPRGLIPEVVRRDA